MGYRIVYEGGEPKTEKDGLKLSVRLQVMTAVCMLVFIIIIKQRWPEATERLKSVFLPGSESAAQTAFYNLNEDLENGMGIGDALVVFCRDLIDNEENSN